MKKITTLMIFAALLILAGCHTKEIKVCSGLIDHMSDTTITTKIGDYDIIFDVRKARYTNGAVMPGDSVTIHYIGDLKEKHAVAAVVYLMPPVGDVVEAGYDPSKELLTSPKSEEDVKKLDEFVEKVKADRRRGIK